MPHLTHLSALAANKRWLRPRAAAGSLLVATALLAGCGGKSGTERQNVPDPESAAITAVQQKAADDAENNARLQQILAQQRANAAGGW